jgi:ABC-type glycerol-3-phosphate transport system substrate-binding protein
VTTRRAVLRAALGPVLVRAGSGVSVVAAGLAGCGGDGAGLEVFVTWGGDELAAFRETLEDFSRQSGRRVRVVPVGEQVDELLRARLHTDNPPDLAVVPRPGLIKQYAARGQVVPLDPAMGRHTPEGLRRIITLDDGRAAGLWVKAAHKSLFWYRPSTFPGGSSPGGSPPRSFAELVDYVRRTAAAGRAPLAIGAADGWVVTDWFENTLVGVGGGAVYDDLAAGRPRWDSPYVTQALARLAELWSVPGAFPDGPARALLTEYEESVVQVFATGRADLVFEGDFVARVIARFGGGHEPGTFPFPAVDGPPPLVVGGDMAALLKDSPGGRELISWLDRPESMYPWIARGGFLSPNMRVPLDRYPTRLARDVAQQLASAPEVRFDLSDQVGGGLGGGQGRGMWRILQEFFGAVTAPGNGADAVRRAQRQLDAAARQVPA